MAEDPLIARLEKREARLLILAGDPYPAGTELADDELLREARAALVQQQEEIADLQRSATRNLDGLTAAVVQLRAAEARVRALEVALSGESSSGGDGSSARTPGP